MFKWPHKEIYSFKLTMLWFSLSSSLSLWPRRRHVALILHCASIWVSVGKDNEEERDNHSIISLNEYISL